MAEQRILIVDYGMGNLGSIVNMLRHLGFGSQISSRPEDVAAADKLIISGVGAFDNAMRKFDRLGILPVLEEKVLRSGTPILGICLGMQLFTRGSEEGELPGFGWFAAETRRFSFAPDQDGLKVPHMGWNLVAQAKASRLFAGMPDEPRFYFVHSYHCVCDQARDLITETNYGYRFASSIERENIFGVQFHPEKSHKFGMKLLENFAQL